MKLTLFQIWLTLLLLPAIFFKNFKSVVSTFCLNSQISNWLVLMQRIGELNTGLLLMLLAQFVPSTSREPNGTKELVTKKELLENRLSLDVERTKSSIETSRKTWNLTGSTSVGGRTRSALLMDAKMMPNNAKVLSEKVMRLTLCFHKQLHLLTAPSLPSSSHNNSLKTSSTSLTP
jgi:hypothetical protein